MRRIFAISDTHRLMVVPPEGYDLAIHLGDFIDYFDVGSVGERAEVYRNRFDEVRRAYTHVVLGNHERMFLSRFGKECIPGELPEYLTLPIEGITVRASHYICLPSHGTTELPFVPETLMDNVCREAIKNNARVVLYGHTHKQRYDQYQGFHLVDTGFGQIGDAAEIIVDGQDVQVNLLQTKRGDRP